MRKQSGYRGFTILELLVVVAIIGLLAVATLALLDNAKLKSRDSRRMSDIGEIRNGLNLYFTEHNIFPVYPAGIDITGDDVFSLLLKTEKVMIDVPHDPASPTYNYIYQSNSSGTNFTISFCLEGSSIKGYSQGCGNTIIP